MLRIERAITGHGPLGPKEMKHPNLDACFDEFEDKIDMSPLKFEERVVRPSLEDKLEVIRRFQTKHKVLQYLFQC